MRFKYSSKTFRANLIITSATVVCFPSSKYQREPGTNSSIAYLSDDDLFGEQKIAMNCPDLKQVMRGSENMSADSKSRYKNVNGNQGDQKLD